MSDNFFMPDVSGIQNESQSLVAQAAAIKVTNQDEYEFAARFAVGVKALIKRVVDTFADPKKAASLAHKSVCAAERKELDTLEAAERRIKMTLSEYLQAEDKRRREEQRRLEEAARKQAEEERLAEAQAAESFFGKEAADAVLEAPVAAVAVAMPPPPKAMGVSARETWSADVFDFKALVKAVAEGRVPAAALIADTKFLNAQARSLKAEFSYPGVRAICEKSVALSA